MPVVVGCALLACGSGCSLITTWDGLEGSKGVDAGVPFDAAPHVTDSAPDACANGSVSCGGHHVGGDPDVLYRCEADGGESLVSRCMYGCLVSATGGDSCRVCDVGGLYCGGDKITGDPNTLYRCNMNGTTSVNEICPKTCVVRPGQDDVCN